ncbi:MAG: DUF1643 domain-containing protein [Pseudomonadota bacterium]
MITRHHTDGATTSWARYSECETYRYALARTWDTSGQKVMFVMLNPSKATEQSNDPTVGRCEARAKQLGYGAFMVTNLFSLRETDPHAMRRHAAPIGPETDQALRDGAAWADITIAAWGVHGVHLGRNAEVAGLFAMARRPLHCLGETKDGHPRHPLYLPYSATPRLWTNP